MSNYSDRFRRQADESRQQAAKAINPLGKESWLRLAEEWLNWRCHPRASVESKAASVRGIKQGGYRNAENYLRRV
jgi:hypothetical protein